MCHTQLGFFRWLDGKKHILYLEATEGKKKIKSNITENLLCGRLVCVIKISSATKIYEHFQICTQTWTIAIVVLYWGAFPPNKYFPLNFVVGKVTIRSIAAGFEVHLLVVLWDPSGSAASTN